MTDDEVANELGRVAGLTFATPGLYWPNWMTVAIRARELCGPTPEEQAVIEAAEAWYQNNIDDRVGGVGPTANLRTSVRRLRESQSPRPRYTISCVRINGAPEFNICDQGVAWASTSSKKFADKIAAALNQSG